MAPISSTESPLTPALQQQLLQLARRAISQGCQQETLRPPPTDALEPPLRVPTAGFVTLTQQGQLRGCMGSLEARRPLAEEIVEDACSAAFRDPRFPPLTGEELPRTRIEISLLSPLEAVAAECREALLAQLRPGVDGLLIESGGNQATFLPQVWEQLPEGDRFLDHLLRKAGLNPARWPEPMNAYRYQVHHFSEPAPG
ncbi:AmmeMemoRadiSam system protein A [Aestuariirhabdus litorea]|uniref:AmmeMemoRadiSam system protein A n=1 Tax=Aestuariirhabdus litorea TaxID=2528527 RepID=A0A3P3VNE4_9GAMM|nr:AmmeMemoRadiSam system protein A [Aestuariirhabdus litorea]RRJ83229.1 AmmeMemoRadiSam system protein A [Aestuariirhabdus litorea]RWW93386.1 AmmeMemoRadiSam system protein A [Endozoicomonadaceae bacterium GTF-13]